MASGPFVWPMLAVLVVPGTTAGAAAAASAEADAASFSPAISADGGAVAFGSRASTITAGDANAADDVFLHDPATGTTTRVSDGPAGEPGNGPAFSPSISADGRYVAFESEAANLVPGDANGVLDVFLHDRQTGTTTRVSVASDGTAADGRSFNPSVSADGRYVAFGSEAANLVPGDTNGTEDIFVHDQTTGTTSRVSVSAGGSAADGRSLSPSISADGRHVAFASFATNLAASDTNAAADVFVHDRASGTTARIGGVEAGGRSFSPSISADGRYVAFASFAADLVPGDTNEALDAFVHDVAGGTTTRVNLASDGTQADGLTFSPVISGDGRYVAFKSEATNLVPGDANGADDVFVHDRTTGRTERVSVASDGAEGDAASVSPSISADGRFVAFSSFASNLVPDDGNGVGDVFVHDRTTGRTVRASVPGRTS